MMSTHLLPFDDPVVWDYLRWHAYFSERHQLLYVATPKVACTTIQWWFADLEGFSESLRQVTDSNESSPELVVHSNFHKLAPHVTGLMPEALAGPLKSPSCFRFAVVRNPFTRLFSAWQSKLMLQEPLQVGPYKQFDFLWMPINTFEDIARAFEAFLRHLASREAPHFADIHWTPQTTLLRPDLIEYSQLVQVEHVQELSSALAAHLPPGTPDPFVGPRSNESLIPFLPEFITAQAADLIRTLYEADFRAFGYDSRRLPPTTTKFSGSELDLAVKAIGLIRGRHRQLEIANHNLSERNLEIQQMAEQERSLQAQMAEQERALTTQMAEQERALTAQIASLEQEVLTYALSTSWQITRPIRKLSRMLRNRL